MTWDEFADAARACGWPAYLGTASTHGKPHVSAVAPGLGPGGIIWVATTAGSGKHRNLLENPRVALHWPVTGAGPGELFARGTAALYDAPEARQRLWTEASLPYDPAHFFGSPENPDLVFIETTVSSASILGADFTRRFWRPGQ